MTFLIFFQVAIKSISKKRVTAEQDLVRIRREIEIMASLGHKHIIQIYEGKYITSATPTHTLSFS